MGLLGRRRVGEAGSLPLEPALSAPALRMMVSSHYVSHVDFWCTAEPFSLCDAWCFCLRGSSEESPHMPCNTHTNRVVMEQPVYAYLRPMDHSCSLVMKDTNAYAWFFFICSPWHRVYRWGLIFSRTNTHSDDGLIREKKTKKKKRKEQRFQQMTLVFTVSISFVYITIMDLKEDKDRF